MLMVEEGIGVLEAALEILLVGGFLWLALYTIFWKPKKEQTVQKNKQKVGEGK